MVSTESTVTEFLMPDTVRLVQWPVITTVLDMPLTLTMLSLQAIVRFTLTPETLRLARPAEEWWPVAQSGLEQPGRQTGWARERRSCLGKAAVR